MLGFLPLRRWRELATRTWSGFWDDDCLMLGAALAYYSVFSLAPLLLTVIAVAGVVFGREAVQGQIHGQVQALIGAGPAEQIEAMLIAAARKESEGFAVTVAGLLTILFGATSAFAALQDSLNRIWHVTPDPNQGGLFAFLSKRLWSLGMVLGIAFLLMVSLVITAILSAMGGWLNAVLPRALSAGMLQSLSAVAGFFVIAALFAAIFRILPDADIQWSDVWVGAALTSLLFSTGRMALGYYLGRSGTADIYGAAGSLVLIVLWLYYASLILLLGAEFTRCWAAYSGRTVRPEPGAMGVVKKARAERVQKARLPGEQG